MRSRVETSADLIKFGVTPEQLSSPKHENKTGN
jgi:hypothetical protein